MTRRRLPIGLQTFRELREEDCYYVDKTGFIARLLDEGKHYFLSRPRRFGKSLFLDTLKELFEGNEALFTGRRTLWRAGVRAYQCDGATGRRRAGQRGCGGVRHGA